MVNWSLVLDVVMIGLLAGTMVYAFVLNRNLERLRAYKTEFETVVQKLVASINHAETGLRDMKLHAQEVGSVLEEQVAHARGLSQELQFMIESGDSLANRLSRAADAGASPSSEMPKQPAGLFAGKKPAEPPPGKTKSRAETQLMEDLGRVAEARAAQTKEAS